MFAQLLPDDVQTEAVRVALAELVERARFRRWVRKVAGKGRLDGADR